MSVLSITSAGKAKTGGETSFVKNAKPNIIAEKILNVIRAVWPTKTAANVAFLTGTSERTVQFWLAGETRMSLEAAAALLKTDAGYDILNAIMGDCGEEWWLVTKIAHDVRTSRKTIKREQERIDQTRAKLNLLDQ